MEMSLKQRETFIPFLPCLVMYMKSYGELAPNRFTMLSHGLDNGQYPCNTFYSAMHFNKLAYCYSLGMSIYCIKYGDSLEFQPTRIFFPFL